METSVIAVEKRAIGQRSAPSTLIMKAGLLILSFIILSMNLVGEYYTNVSSSITTSRIVANFFVLEWFNGILIFVYIIIMITGLRQGSNKPLNLVVYIVLLKLQNHNLLNWRPPHTSNTKSTSFPAYVCLGKCFIARTNLQPPNFDFRSFGGPRDGASRGGPGRGGPVRSSGTQGRFGQSNNRGDPYPAAPPPTFRRERMESRGQTSGGPGNQGLGRDQVFNIGRDQVFSSPGNSQPYGTSSSVGYQQQIPTIGHGGSGN